jgi:cation transport regulator ChaC
MISEPVFRVQCESRAAYDTLPEKRGLLMALGRTHGVLMRLAMTMLWRKRRRLIAKSWVLARLYYPLRGVRLAGRPNDEIWYFAYGANMHEATFRVRRSIQPSECRPGCKRRSKNPSLKRPGSPVAPE